MILRMKFAGFRKNKDANGVWAYEYEGWFLFGFIPLYVHQLGRMWMGNV